MELQECECNLNTLTDDKKDETLFFTVAGDTAAHGRLWKEGNGNSAGSSVCLADDFSSC